MVTVGDSLATLQQRATEAQARAEALTAAYNRRTWYRFTAVFFPIPFVVVLLRLNLDYWHYYLAGGGYLLFAALLYAFDTRFSDRVKAAEKEAADAQRLVEAAAEVH
jgi:hypothetical protein